MSLFVRTCQECGHKQEMKDPGTQRGDGWTEAKCRRCKSPGALDYGSDGWMRADDGALVRENIRPTREEMMFEMDIQLDKEGISEADKQTFHEELDMQSEDELLTTFSIFWNARI